MDLTDSKTSLKGAVLYMRIIGSRGLSLTLLTVLFLSIKSGVFLVSVQDYFKKFPRDSQCLPSISRIHSVVSLGQTLQVLVLSFHYKLVEMF